MNSFILSQFSILVSDMRHAMPLVSCPQILVQLSRKNSMLRWEPTKKKNTWIKNLNENFYWCMFLKKKKLILSVYNIFVFKIKIFFFFRWLKVFYSLWMIMKTLVFKLMVQQLWSTSATSAPSQFSKSIWMSFWQNWNKYSTINSKKWVLIKSLKLLLKWSFISL